MHSGYLCVIALPADFSRQKIAAPTIMHKQILKYDGPTIYFIRTGSNTGRRCETRRLQCVATLCPDPLPGASDGATSANSSLINLK